MSRNSTPPWKVVIPPLPWHRTQVLPADGDLVILIHGLWRSIHAMEAMASHLHQKNFHTINIAYPSFRKSIESHVRFVLDVIEKHNKNSSIHFVTHSLGGIIARHLSHHLPPHQLGRIVMLAPPNQGSEIIPFINRFGPLKYTLGPSGQQLHIDNIDAPLFPDSAEIAVIMGNRRKIPFFHSLLEEENDGIVSVNSGKLPGIKEFHVTPTDHTFITTNSRVKQMTSQFLQKGKISEIKNTPPSP